MGEHIIKLPDVGEGVAEAELVEWHVKIGDIVREDTVLAAVMTDKATVEIPSPVDGEILWLGAEIGDTVAIGSPIVRLKVAGEGNVKAAGKEAEPTAEAEAPAKLPSPKPETAPSPKVAKPAEAPVKPASPAEKTTARASAGAPRPEGEKPLASPAVRLRAKEAGIDLRQVTGSGPAGRIGHEDIEAFLARGPQLAKTSGLASNDAIEDIKLVGLRRKIAEKMTLSKSRIPHITYVEEIDVTPLEELRAALNKEKRPAKGGAERPKLTLLPFLMRAMVKAIADQPQLNSLFDDEAGIIHQHGGIHIGIAAQTPSGLVVPVVKHAEARDIWDCGAEVARLAEAAKSGTATRDDLSGSTITITSLGAMGGVATTPVINHPEVAIIGVNKMMVRPVWDGTQFIPRKMMNLSSSFDHRVIDGWDAAVFVQRIKALLETPALIFVD
ncbi:MULTISPECIES: dihydrolipoamide acetyltransferase family protein [unclassified Mesorhizobium]|uniref:dihydrolipoamide acetyltransferase family protein n=1 Tax=unclassified Mesorhizobium TaxID=325217 RepID=UPI000FD98BEF|nr:MULTISPECIES: dihydrolipoamide acetyltransferase family protein [unclassified Mesorhizobium]RWC67742.1 MAG: 2-oxo acid dehydrogenase subunit E2 [Mesorhizobium sp.]TGR36566.1 2-oxo acid dehydrogenase subunit E2 [bacterium M00.F.Ca.ET.199.01.1.1]TGU28204.1 2-oxo acid dehydrogenase subunit E2 [bacterium M00.F.Ca.ET.156.01.1.1]TGV81674.1 2-oxo acid dehydrogenase subunit E2 [Mesorhizobium sp. M00.F.Ca.ET.149.01.1.1]TGP85572.1 2-oxo acid dehydrogenase subunit E2 [Mesorhizobium sp. M8A.F.Ca.ET.218